jgi:DNA-binding winged helix-turn-helix (wHTH) protein/Tol biopolymer transport system component
MNEASFSRKVKQIKFGSWILDPKKQTINDGEIERELEPLLFRILSYLIINNDHIVTRNNLVEDVWCQHYVDDNAINRAMSELRKVLKSNRQKGIVVKTHYKKGYSFFLEPEIIYHEDTSPQLTPQTVVERSISSDRIVEPRKGSKISYLLIAVCIAALIYLTQIFNVYEFSNIDPSNTETPIVIEQSYETQLLTWGNGQYNGLLLHPTENYIAYMQGHIGERESRVVLRDLVTSKEERFGHVGEYLYPIGWSDRGEKLIYRRELDDQCQIWQSSIKDPENNKLEYLFECDKRLYRAAGLNNGDIAYTKYNYRNRDELSVIMIRDLETGSEFQVSSPNLNSFGDKLLHYDPISNKLFFERVQYGYSELFVSDPEGTEQTKLTVVNNRVWVANYDHNKQLLTWFDNKAQQVHAFSTATKQLETIISASELDDYLFAYLTKDESLIAITSPYEQDLYSVSLLDGSSKSYAKSEKAEHSVSISKGLTAFFSGSSALVIELQGVRNQIKLPNESYFSIDISSDEQSLILVSQEKIDIYDIKGKKVQNLIQPSGKLLFAKYLNDRSLGYITKHHDTGEHQAFVYDLKSGRSVRLTISESTWFSYLNENLLVYKSLQDKLVFFDLNETEIVKELPILKSQIKHSFSAFGNTIYHSDGNAIYKVSLKDRVLDPEPIFRLDQPGHINHLDVSEGQRLMIEVVSSKSNFLIKANKL